METVDLERHINALGAAGIKTAEAINNMVHSLKIGYTSNMLDFGKAVHEAILGKEDAFVINFLSPWPSKTTPAVIIGIRIFIGKRSADFWRRDKVAPAVLDKRKSVKSKVWVTPEMLPLIKGDIIRCVKTGRRYKMQGVNYMSLNIRKRKSKKHGRIHR